MTAKRLSTALHISAILWPSDGKHVIIHVQRFPSALCLYMPLLALTAL